MSGGPPTNRHLRLVLDEQERERSDLAHRLHDQLAQSLAAVLFGLEGVERRAEAADAARLAALREQLADALSLCTELASDLRPAVLDELGLAPALESLAKRVGVDQVSVDPSLAAERLGRDFDTDVYRAVEDALAAVGPDSALSVSLERGGREASVSVSSPGSALAPDALDALEGRLELIGGSVGQGPRMLTIRIPMPLPGRSQQLRVFPR